MDILAQVLLFYFYFIFILKTFFFEKDAVGSEIGFNVIYDLLKIS